MPLSPPVRLALVGALVAVLALSACTPDPDVPPVLDGWQTIALPDGLVPSAMQLSGDALLVGGHVGAGADRAPALARVRVTEVDAAPVSVPLTPATPYGKVADLVSLSADGSQIVALGAARGGAHANARWTIWTGSVAGVVDRPQTFETFGGQQAGGLLDVVWDRQGPLIVGTWQGADGLDGAIWRAAGRRWVRQPTPTALSNTATRQVAPNGADSQPDGSAVVNGAVIDLADGVRQSAAYWRGSGSDWRLTLQADPGRRSEVWSTACAAVCRSVGARDGALAVWSDGVRESVPAIAVDDADAGVVVGHDDRTVAAVSSQEGGRLLVGHDGRWRVYRAPAGEVRAAALVGSRLYLVAGSVDAARLVVRDLADVLTR